MKFDEILKVIKDLSVSQGFYGRLLRHINSLDESELENLKQDWESKNFADEIDFIMWIEG